MPKKQLIRLKDLDTGEDLVFKTLQAACDYINELTGAHIIPSGLHKALKNCGTVAKKRFACCSNPKDHFPQPDMVKDEDGWRFNQFGVSDTVLSAEKKIKWYDEERMESITKDLIKEKCKVFWDMESDYWGSQRKNTRVEVYKKFQGEISFEDKILIMKDILKRVNFL